MPYQEHGFYQLVRPGTPALGGGQQSPAWKAPFTITITTSTTKRDALYKQVQNRPDFLAMLGCPPGVEPDTVVANFQVRRFMCVLFLGLLQLYEHVAKLMRPCSYCESFYCNRPNVSAPLRLTYHETPWRGPLYAAAYSASWHCTARTQRYCSLQLAQLSQSCSAFLVVWHLYITSQSVNPHTRRGCQDLLERMAFSRCVAGC